MSPKWYFAVLALSAIVFSAAARGNPRSARRPDGVQRSDTVSLRNQRLYDSIRNKANRRAVPRFFYRMFFVGPKADTTSGGRALDQSRLYEPYAGRTIAGVEIDRGNVFDPNGNFFERAGNRIHRLTAERVIRRDLLFGTDDRLDPEQLVRTMQLLRSRSYISDVGIVVRPDSADTTRVRVTVRTRDSWTLSADADLRSRGRTGIGLLDANVLGSGNRLFVTTYFDRRDFSYGGNRFAYEIPNLWGSFFAANASAGRNFSESELKFSLSKEFIKPTDYGAGAAYERAKSEFYRVDLDTTDLVQVRRLDFWAGRSRYLASIRSSVFLTGRFTTTRHLRRPEVAPAYNPAFHDADDLLFGAGLYREKFYTANRVYGFGAPEYLAAGYQARLIVGYSWREFDNNVYLGTGYKTGGFTRGGYLMGGFTLGSYIGLSTGAWTRSAVDVDLRWFSNLYVMRRSRIRQFLSLNYTQGWNRDRGCDELLRFTQENGLQLLREDVVGLNRMVLNTETVLFTPYQPLGFRIALFGFADFGLLGADANPFRNAFYTTLGVGIRIKNERLIFHEFQLQFGIALGRDGWADSRYFRASNATRLEQYRYRPTPPEIVPFR